jgi:hypothetical protein
MRNMSRVLRGTAAGGRHEKGPPDGGPELMQYTE